MVIDMNYSTVVVSATRWKLEWPSSDTSRAGITPIADTRPWVMNLLSATKGGIQSRLDPKALHP
jgi:hypothetical protein